MPTAGNTQDSVGLNPGVNPQEICMKAVSTLGTQCALKQIQCALIASTLQLAQCAFSGTGSNRLFDNTQEQSHSHSFEHIWKIL